ncbi:hypothetical protein Pam3_57 [Pseudanabaena phage Pam3]|nr:hypothetical protein Pam3_57 [Pseudanabaena phage Pam3]
MTPTQLCRYAATGSRDPSTKVGAVVTNADGLIVGGGFNDFPPGIPDHWWEDRELKYRGVVHAEANAILEAGRFHCLGGTIYVSAHPCRDCAKLIVASGLKKVVCPSGPWRDDPAIIATVNDAAELLQLCGIEMEEIGE